MLSIVQNESSFPILLFVIFIKFLKLFKWFSKLLLAVKSFEIFKKKLNQKKIK